MNETQNKRLKELIEELFLEYKSSQKEFDIILDLFSKIDELYLHTFFTEESKDHILNYIKSNSEIQDTILDFINKLYLRMELENIKTSFYFSTIKDTTINFTSDKSGLDKELLEHLKYDKECIDSIVMQIALIIKVFGINGCFKKNNLKASNA